MEEEEEGLSRLVPKPLKPFKSTDEYIYAMKEDLAYWFNGLYGTELSADTLLAQLEDGVLLCRHVNGVCGYIRAAAAAAASASERRGGGSGGAAAASEVAYRSPVRPKTFQARDNVANFIAWLRSHLGMRDTLLFETDDLVLGKNEKNVVLSLLELARRGARYGVPAPLLVQLEQEIERTDSSTCSSGDESLRRQQQLQQQRGPDNQTLDELVRSSLSRCTCPSQFPLIQIAPGKYKFGDNQTTVFVRVLRSHVMIRVGGGWDTLERYLDKHDPCRCKALGHRRGSVPIVDKPLKVLPSKFAVVDGKPADRPPAPSAANHRRPSDSMCRTTPRESAKRASPPSMHKGFYSTLNLRESGEQTLRQRGRSGSNLSLFAGASGRDQPPRSGRSTPRDPPQSSLVVSRDQSGRHRVSDSSSSNPASPGHVQRSFSPVPFASYGGGGGSSRPSSPVRRRLNRVARDVNHRRSTSEPSQVLSRSAATALAADDGSGGGNSTPRDRSARAWPTFGSPRKDKVQSARPTRIPQPVANRNGRATSPDADACSGTSAVKWSSSAMRKVDSGVEMTSDDSDTSHV